MDNIRIIKVKESILAENHNQAELIRNDLLNKKVFMLNLMSSPGAGKTTIIVETIRRLKSDFRLAVIEGDIQSKVDAEKVAAEGVAAIQLETGGACHLDAPMIQAALDKADLSSLDGIIVENVGNLVCPAEFDTGAACKAMILSVPEGDDKVLKYPLMFSVCDVLIISKTDYLSLSDFNTELLEERVREINPGIKIFRLSAKTGEGMEAWCQWLGEEIKSYKR